MGMFVNPDNNAFQAALNARIYVDKSELIAFTNAIIESTDAFICNSRPRRFGKSITADMIAAYYSRGCNSHDMFSRLKISKTEDFSRYLNHYDVIYFDVQWCMEPAGGPEHVVSFITERVLRELREVFPGVLEGSIHSLPEALSVIHTAEQKKFVIIIDEWDVLIRDVPSDHHVQEEYISFLRGLFKGSFPARYTALAYMTGILPIKKLNTQSALNNFDEFTMLSPGELTPYIGFTEEEVGELCTQYGRNFEEVRRWYDGYRLEDRSVYNPQAVVNVMTKGRYKSYWSDTGTYESVVPLINMDFDGLKTAVVEMLSGVSTPVDVYSFRNDTVSFANKDDVITCLIHLGYLGYDDNSRTAFVPNEEIRQELSAAVKKTEWNEMLSFELESSELLAAVLRMDQDAVAWKMEQIHMKYASAVRYHDENSLSCVLTIAFLSSMRWYFKPVREMPSGKGFADFVYVPKPEYATEYPALLVELKWDKDAVTAVDQIKERRYPDSLTQYTGNILLVGINYDRKSKVHTCAMERMP